MLTSPSAVVRRRTARLSACLGAIAALSTLASSAGAQTFTGTEVKLAVDPSIDIMRDHVQFLALQDRYDAMLGYLAMTERFSPLRYVHDDGTKSGRVAHRAETMLGGGYGTPELGFMVGAWTDIVMVGPTSDMQFQGIFFGGLAFYGVQATYSAFESAKLDGIDPYGSFGSHKGGSDDYTYRPGGGAPDAGGRASDAFTFYHSSGASLVVMRSTPAGGSVHVTDVRAQLQPLKQWLDDKFGLPMLAVQKLDPARALADARTSGAQAVTRPDTLPARWDVELGSDNLLNQGIRAHLLGSVRPSITFRSAELGAYRDIDDLTIAARTFAYVRDERFRLSAEGFVRYSVLPPGKESLGFPVAVAASYSYDSPDSATFIPLPYAHVFGIQIILGAPDIAKPIVPIVRPKKPREASANAGGAR